MSKNQAGKGDTPRPINKGQFDKNFDKIKWGSTSSDKPKEFSRKGKTTYKY